MNGIAGLRSKAIFANLQSAKPIQNVVPQPAPPVLARKN
jgi:hypothetical protein